MLIVLTSSMEYLSFPPLEHADTIFSEIGNLSTIAEHANIVSTTFQKINMVPVYF